MQRAHIRTRILESACITSKSLNDVAGGRIEAIDDLQSFRVRREQIVSPGFAGRYDLLGHFLRLVMVRDGCAIIYYTGSRSGCNGKLKGDPNSIDFFQFVIE